MGFIQYASTWRQDPTGDMHSKEVTLKRLFRYKEEQNDPLYIFQLEIDRTNLTRTFILKELLLNWLQFI